MRWSGVGLRKMQWSSNSSMTSNEATWTTSSLTPHQAPVMSIWRCVRYCRSITLPVLLWSPHLKKLPPMTWKNSFHSVTSCTFVVLVWCRICAALSVRIVHIAPTSFHAVVVSGWRSGMRYRIWVQYQLTLSLPLRKIKVGRLRRLLTSKVKQCRQLTKLLTQYNSK